MRKYFRLVLDILGGGVIFAVLGAFFSFFISAGVMRMLEHPSAISVGGVILLVLLSLPVLFIWICQTVNGITTGIRARHSLIAFYFFTALLGSFGFLNFMSIV